jgi:hypothetical protein
MKETILKKIKINRNKPKRKSAYTKANHSQYINDRHNKSQLNDRHNKSQLNDKHNTNQLNDIIIEFN